MPKIQIICTSPGMRRRGAVHPATAIYPAGHWSDDDLAAFRADPAFAIREIGEAENIQTADDFEIRVANEVDARVNARIVALAASFDQAVADKAAERAKEAEEKAEIRIKAAAARHLERITVLERELAEAVAKAPKPEPTLDAEKPEENPPPADEPEKPEKPKNRAK